MSAPDLTRKVIGFRSWLLDDELALRSAGYGQLEWKAAVNEASCLGPVDPETGLPRFPDGPPAHAAPHHHCECGLYSYHDIPVNWLAAGDPEARRGNTHHGYAYGAVAAWGRIEAHRSGFRAEFAQPLALAYTNLTTVLQLRRIERTGRAMGLKVMPVSELAAFAAGYGERVPASLLPNTVPPTDFDTINFRPGGLLPPGIAAISGGQVTYVTTFREPEPPARRGKWWWPS